MEGGAEDENCGKSFQEKKDVLLRQYQIKLIEDAEKHNTIIFLPTGAGKTFIALWIIKSRSHEVRTPYNEGGKRTFYLVNAKPLVDQQAAVIEEMTDLTVGRYTGDIGVDFWDKKQWQEELGKHQVLVMTAQILVNMLSSAFISMGRINVMVFDECHHAVSDHPYRVILRQFENVAKPERPLVLGLSATLLNGNLKTKQEGHYVLMDKVNSYVHELETTFQGTIATSEELSDVLKFSTCPTEKYFPFSPVDKNRIYNLVLKIYDEAQKNMNLVIFPSDEDINAADAPKNSFRYKKDNSMNKRVRNSLEDAKTHLELLGLYGGAVTDLYYIIQFEKLRMLSPVENESELINFVITTLNKIRRIKVRALPTSVSMKDIKDSSSPKVCELLETIYDYYHNRMKGEKLACIVFVERRVTAIVLCHILKILSKEGQKLNFLSTDFIIGGSSNPMKETRECILEQIRNEDVIQKFVRHEINLLVATNVLEEGIDLPFCNLIVMFDKPKDYRSYVQSKGRARNKLSEYAVLVEEDERHEFGRKLEKYRCTEEALKQLLIGKTDDREIPSDEVIQEELYKSEIEPYYVNGPGSAYVTGESAISCIERYCQSFPQDYYSLLSPMVWLRLLVPGSGNVNRKVAIGGWKKKEDENSDRLAILQLPIASPLREDLEGDVMVNNKLAKRSVCVKAVKRLHEMGELTDELNPRRRVIDDNDPKIKALFPHYVKENIEKDKPQPGTKQRTQIYSIQHAECLSGCLPKPDTTLFLHVITTEAVYKRPDDSRRGTIHDLLNSSSAYAILSSKALPKTCKFPIFSKAGRIDCDLLVNAEKISLNEAQLAEIKKFHFDIFDKLLGLVKVSMVFDISNEENSFFIVPVDKSSDDSYSIQWDIVKKQDSFPKRRQANDKNVKRILAEFLTEDQTNASAEESLKRVAEEKNDDGNVSPNKKRKMDTPQEWPDDDKLQNLRITEEMYNLTVVAPYYRVNTDYYIVTKVCHNMSPMSAFPDNDKFDSYFDYFQNKYTNVKIRQTTQPLLEVKGLAKGYNFLRPRTPAKTGGIKGKKKRLEEEDGFNEHLVPELCIHYPFPAVLWLKATLLPSILYRFSNVFTIEEFRKKVAEETSLGLVDLPAGQSWADFGIDESCIKGQEEKYEKVPLPTRAIINPKHSVPDSVKSKTYVFDGETMPMDLERNMNEVAPVDLRNYMTFACKRSNSETARLSPSRTILEKGPCDSVILPPKVYKYLDLIQRKTLSSKVELAELVQAFTTSKANDICSLERLETLGDSFLKFAAAVFSYRRFTEFDEGKLVSLKDKTVGNKNLLYCARAKGFAPLIIVDDFEPKSDWNPPLFKIPKILQSGICSKMLSISTIYNLSVPAVERFSGNLSASTLHDINELLKDGTVNDKSSPMELLLSRKTIPDKTVADCTEALIGVYLKNCGIEGGFKFLNWLGAMPEATYSNLIESKVPNAFLKQDKNDGKDLNFHLNVANSRKLEETLNYRFNEKSFLLEALTHSSYVKNRLTYNYQRLEFLGDAILDFLITCYIYNYCGNLTPGQLTDLRSALVNNVTFACLAVKYNFHKYLVSLSSSLMEPINRFAKHQEERGHVVDEAVLILLNESECKIAESVEVPKTLGDVFESIAGAIFLDSGNSLEAVWRVFYPLMKKEIDAFSENTPKQPIRLLHEAIQYKPTMKTTLIPESKNVMVSIEILTPSGSQIFHGVGRNAQLAKKSAAKHALKFILENKKCDE